jgi:predicted phage-related endonuclease
MLKIATLSLLGFTLSAYYANGSKAENVPGCYIVSLKDNQAVKGKSEL